MTWNTRRRIYGRWGLSYCFSEKGKDVFFCSSLGPWGIRGPIISRMTRLFSKNVCYDVREKITIKVYYSADLVYSATYWKIFPHWTTSSYQLIIIKGEDEKKGEIVTDQSLQTGKKTKRKAGERGAPSSFSFSEDTNEEEERIYTELRKN